MPRLAVTNDLNLMQNQPFSNSLTESVSRDRIMFQADHPLTSCHLILTGLYWWASGQYSRPGFIFSLCSITCLKSFNPLKALSCLTWGFPSQQLSQKEEIRPSVLPLPFRQHVGTQTREITPNEHIQVLCLIYDNLKKIRVAVQSFVITTVMLLYK